MPIDLFHLMITGVVTSATDDDASSWNQFSDMLNFQSYAQSMFTLFEMSVIGTWSQVASINLIHICFLSISVANHSDSNPRLE